MARQILIIDDNADDRSHLNTILGGAGFRVIEASTPAEALTAASEQAIAMVLMEPATAGLDAADFLGRVRSQGLDAPVMFITGKLNTAILQECMQYGVSEFMLKPVAAEELHKKLENTLGEEEVAQAKIVENSCTILIVDDSERVPPALENLLHDDFTVQSATNRDEAIELAKANSFPIIVVDLDIPGEDTFELAEDLREQQPEARVIGLYPRKMRYPSIRYSEEGFDGFLVKPFVQEQVDAVTSPEGPSDEDPGFLLRSDSLLQALKYNPKDGEVEEYYDALAVQMTNALNELGAECAEEVILDLRFLPDNPKRDELLQNCSSLCEEVCIEPKVIGKPAIQPVFPDGTPFFKSLKALLEG